MRAWKFYRESSHEGVTEVVRHCILEGGDSNVLTTEGGPVINAAERRSKTYNVDLVSALRISSLLRPLLDEIQKDFQCNVQDPFFWKVNKYSPGDFFQPHRDRAAAGDANGRCLTLVIGLDSLAGLRGGKLELLNLAGGIWERHTLSFALAREEALVFDANLLHRVTPVELGERRTLVAFLKGASL